MKHLLGRSSTALPAAPKAHKRRGLGVTLTLGAAAALAIATPALASAASSAGAASAAAVCGISSSHVKSMARTHHIAGVIAPATTGLGCAQAQTPPPPEPAFNGTPPLLFNGAGGAADCVAQPCDNGDVMMTHQTGPLVITPIFWDPAGHPMTAAYKDIITSYLRDVALASGQPTNVYSVLNEYYGNNGQIHYNIRLGTPVNATNALPKDGCQLAGTDRKNIYADGTGYNACLDDAQLQAEVDSVTAALGLPHNLSNIYVLYTAKGVESCFFAGSTTTTANACTINHQPSASYCAYHSTDVNSAVYANLSYPIYASPVGFTCGTDGRYPVIESPNNNPDADTEISPTSHEVSEAITDPDTQTGWYDSHGNEIGDDCAYIYGATNGQAGALYNQTINGQHFITQQEFSNNVFNASGGTAGCVDSLQAEG
jgi:hypothetical protein